MLSRFLLAASRSGPARYAAERAPVSRRLARRFVAGGTGEDAVRTSDALIAAGLRVALEYLGEDTRDPAAARAVRDEYTAVLGRLGEAGLGRCVELTLNLSDLGCFLARPDRRAMQSTALDHARAVCAAAQQVGAAVTLGMEDHSTTDVTLAAARDLRADFPWVGVVLQSRLRRTEGDLHELCHAGSRIRLVKGAYAEPAAVAHRTRAEADRAYARCLRILMEGHGRPMVATHDPRLIEIAGALAVTTRRPQDSYEFQMLLGVRSQEQRRLARAGETVRIHVPYGRDWYGCLMRRLAERPDNLTFALRAIPGRG